jgi:leader peptidase (prepilin peptidase)/N-methyltransferase
MPALIATAAGGFGLLIGSFLNVVVWRVPRGESLVAPASHCPNCGHPIRAYDNVPVLSWLVLRGRCRDCRARIAVRYPLVELGTGVAFALVTAWWATTRLSEAPSIVGAIVELAAWLYLAAITIALALIDLDVYRLPNAIVLPSYVVVAVLLGTTALLEGDGWAALRSLIGGVALLLFYLVVALIAPRGMGLGDVKLAGVLGIGMAWVGWGPWAVGAFAAFLLGGLFGIVLLLVRRAGRKSRIPFGPWMLGGAWIGIVAGDAIGGSYLTIVGLG